MDDIRVTRGPGVVVAAVLAVACAVGGLVMLSRAAEGGFVLGLAALHGVYAACVHRKHEPGRAPTRLLRATRVLLVLECIAGAALVLADATVDLGCRDCAGAAILIVAPLFAVEVITLVTMVLELVVLLVLFRRESGTGSRSCFSKARAG